ncbi:aryl-alcohol dehydrogenase-like predicted oxidoreductase [Mycetocola sp. BIGb0189]|uniref:aldo/keto reductase n=1 Tax=Mycetocola sp. BIGb0189 TaxID=2940604 RepID=UPI002166FCDA|nr:aldo/keto reductase [Mycetocola sp. BIGb0189]MCS4275187.1 aryl-alcohol dehydrogenase-like predicted oxidoreductase [Mycetocola sp. BIGb0189]
MEQRSLGKTGRSVSAIGLGTWQLGADWGEVSEADALAVLEESVAAGVTFFDTADVYGDGRSERFIRTFRERNPEQNVFVATKIGRRLEQLPENYSRENFTAWVDRSRTNLGVDTLDLVQLHCPPSAVYTDQRVFDALDELVEKQAIAAYGVSVEESAQALTAIERPGLSSVQIILNPFRLKPLDEVLPAALAHDVGIIARVPLASGLLSGKYTADTVFPENDHRTYNRNGEAFDRGETFSGVDFADGLAAAQEFAAALPEGVSVPQAALRWLIDQPGVTAAIPGARNVRQALANAGAADLPRTSPELDARVHEIYDRYFRATVHPQW